MKLVVIEAAATNTPPSVVSASPFAMLPRRKEDGELQLWAVLLGVAG